MSVNRVMHQINNIVSIVNVTDGSYPYITHVSPRPYKATLKHLYTHSILYTINNIQ